MVYIPTGEFRMGVEEDDIEANEFEKPQHVVYLSAFWIDLTEVTNEMYELCVGQDECRPPRDLGSNTHTTYYGDADFNNHPVIFVSWEDANDYCRWAGRRLPSEAEWEKAARGTDGRNFPWGDASPTIRFANYGGLLGDTDEAGAYPAGASPYGLLDMAGNVAEWVTDWYDADYYAVSPYRDPIGPEEGDFRMIRGGSWFNSANALRTTARLWNYPDLQSETIGFRCAK
jgi:formylglycine-generating enzyme required for sulfatase activity